MIKEHIDEAMEDQAWIQQFLHDKIPYLTLEGSYRVLILLSLVKDSKEGCKPFRFLRAWMRDFSNKQVMRDTWESIPFGGLEVSEFDEDWIVQLRP